MPPRQNYPRPPIVEAVLLFQLAVDVEAGVVFDVLKDTIGENYKGDEEKRDLMAAQMRIDQEGFSANASRSVSHTMFMRSSDGLRLVGVAPGVLSVHVLAPYPGWERFVEQASEAVEALPDEVRSAGFRSIVVRYIDRIVFPSNEAIQLSEYFNTIPLHPSSLPQELSGFHFVTQSQEGPVSAMMTLASAPSDGDGRPVVLYDLQLSQSGSDAPVATEDDWLSVAENLHERLRDAFEESITEKTRDLFR